MSNIWFTADTHFGHKNIIKHCRSQFATVEDMNECLVDNWNRYIQPDDDVYHLGDLSFMSKTKTTEILSRLHGKIHLVRGNHDHDVLKESVIGRFVWVKDVYNLKVPDPDCAHPKQGGYQTIVLCHFPFQVWDHVHHGAWHLHGHSHGTLPIDMTKCRHDVGVDNNFLKPVSYERIKQIMATKRFEPADHHGASDDGPNGNTL